MQSIMNSNSLKISDNKTEIFHDEDLTSISLDDSIEETNPGRAVWLIVCAVSMGGFLFGKFYWWSSDVACSCEISLIE